MSGGCRDDGTKYLPAKRFAIAVVVVIVGGDSDGHDCRAALVSTLQMYKKNLLAFAAVVCRRRRRRHRDT